MANPLRAECQVSVDAGTYTLAYSLGALATIKEKKPGVSLNDLLTGLGSQGADAVDDIALLIWAGLNKYHRDMSIEDVYDLVEMTDLPKWSSAIIAAIGGGAPAPEGAAKNPQKAAAKK